MDVVEKLEAAQEEAGQVKSVDREEGLG